MTTQPTLSRPERRAQRRTDRRSRSLLYRARRPLFAFGLVAVAGISAAGYALSQIPLPDEDPLTQTTFICAGDVVEDCNRENSLAQLSGGVDRVSVTYDDIPPVLIDAVLAAEDRDYFVHAGIDPVGIVRAAWSNVRAQDVVQGGSSITQQYVKNAFLTDEATVERKIKEAVLAIKIEKELTKEEILLRYLNTIYFGRGAYGVEAAARVYFAKDLDQLTVADAAYLAALIRSPGTADAVRGTDDAEADEQRATAEIRRESVLDAMLQEDFITADQRAEAQAVALEPPNVLAREDASNFGMVAAADVGTEYFVEYVRRFLVEQAGFDDADIFGGGLRVYTTIDLDLQRQAFGAVTSNLDQPDDPQGALVTVGDDGQVLAMVAGTDWDESQVNMAVGLGGGGSGRQAGSAFKPFALAAALEQGISAESFFPAPDEIVIPGADAGEDWTVSNYSDGDQGNQTLIEATQASTNTVYAQLMTEVGPENVTALAQDLGITSPLEPVPALVLGTGDVSVIDMAGAYSSFPRGGEQIDPIVVTRVEDRDGNVLVSYEPERERVMDELNARTMSWILSQVIQGGTGRRAGITQPAGGKTGTTEDYRDAWFAGFTCKLTTVVWVGYAEPDADGNPRYMTNVGGTQVSGGSLPASIWRDYMEGATSTSERCELLPPSAFVGEILNPELATTTTTTTVATTATVDPAATTTTTVDPDATTTTAESPATDTTLPPEPTLPPPTLDPGPTTTTAAPAAAVEGPSP